ncbi:aminopeptidase N [Marinicella rhabdoformis]|uniref:aminopeptidase N n=1 Tax=Marinicella rhabdoformis TaxID=2580566 RepID=UPI0012AED196|nr:aminopeptidase N [Marinicella rhabdoformis]
MRIYVKYPLFLLLTLLLGCQQQPISDNTTTKTSTTVKKQVSKSRVKADLLNLETAQSRKNRLSDINYVLNVDLVRNKDAYLGQVTVQFNLNANTEDLTIDFTGGTVSEVTINNNHVDVNYNGFFVTLPSNALLQGKNSITLTYQHPYNQDGTGLHKFVDPEDGNTYLYTYLWPYYANRLFPNFDQPNLKAQYELTVQAPENWQVVSAMTEDDVSKTNDIKTWHFPPSKKFSSYIFSLHAGPYQLWEDQAGDVPIRLLARQSLAQYVPVEEWMGYTKMGLSHFKNYFDIAYPFEKYDQVIVPDFNIGAMENVAAVTFTESVIQRGESNRFQRQRRASIILHEMAHMWFGNLVTKDWWNGLWLNESFATLMSAIAVSELPEFKDLWHDFYLNVNLRAITADKMISTHPIEVPVNSTNDFFQVFDDITYQKGASVLNQLSHFVGQENFRLAVSNYLKQHAWGNTELEDFVAAQSKQSGIELTEWSKSWLYQAGVNTFKINFQCEADKISGFTINQTADEKHPQLRTQKTQLALFKLQDNELKPYHITPLQVTGESTQVPAVIGLDCPTLAYPNYQGWGFVEVELDEVSKNNAFDALTQLKDPLMRSMLWTSLLSDEQINLLKVIDALYVEKNDRIINQIQNSLISKLNTKERQGDPNLMALSHSLEEMLWNQIKAKETSKNIKLIKLQSFFSVVRSENGQAILLKLLSGELTINEIPITQGFRWQMISRLAGLNHPESKTLIANEKTKDPSDSGMLAAIAAEAALPVLAIKKQWVDQFLNNDNPLPLSHQRKAMESLFPANQVALQEQLLTEMLAALPMIKRNRDNYYQRSYARDLFAGICTENGLKLIQTASDKKTIGTTLYRFLSENVQKAEACVKGL